MRTPSVVAALLLGAALAVPASASLAPMPGSSRLPRGGPLAPATVEDGVLFRYQDAEARHVSLVGRFNEWDEGATPLCRTRDGVWRVVVDLGEGPWPYFYVVDGEWRRDPDNPIVDAAEQAHADAASLLRIENGEVIDPRPARFREATFGATGSYDRVDQARLATWLKYDNRARLHPELTFRGARSFGRDRWLYDVAVVQPLIDSRLLDVGVRVFRVTDTPDRDRMGETENSLATFFFREDWRDYHEAEGTALHATAYLGRSLELTARWRGEDHRSLSKTTDWGLFGGEKRMRVNPAVDDGELRIFTAETDLDTRNSKRNPTRGLRALGSYELAGGEFGGDFEFRRGTLELRRYLKLSRGHYFDFRVMGGRIDGAKRGAGTDQVEGFAAVPVQERFYLGGTGTLRGTQFKSVTGDRLLLANAEMRVEIFPELQAVAFVDVGDAWIESATDLDLKTDAGVGIQDSDSSFRVNLAKKVDGRDDPEGFIVSARIQRMF